MTSEINILSRCGLFPLSNSWLGTAVFRGNCFEIPLASLPNSATHHGILLIK